MKKFNIFCKIWVQNETKMVDISLRSWWCVKSLLIFNFVWFWLIQSWKWIIIVCLCYQNMYCNDFVMCFFSHVLSACFCSGYYLWLWFKHECSIASAIRMYFAVYICFDFLILYHFYYLCWCYYVLFSFYMLYLFW